MRQKENYDCLYSADKETEVNEGMILLFEIIKLFHGLTKPIVKGMGCVPVNRKIHDKNALQSAYNYLNNDLCVGIFPEGTINRTDKTIMNFKIGAVKACNKTDTKLVPFVITGKYKLFRKGIKIEFLKPIKISLYISSS